MQFMDFCSGIGGGRLGLELNSLNCVGHSEIDKCPDKTYQLLFNDFNNYGDVTKIDSSNLPNFDVLIGGFPCQTFSIAGKRKGFDDERGMIIHSLTKILKEKNTPYFIMENVKGLVNHNKGETLNEILNIFSDLNYNVYWKVLDSQYYGVPQMRERVYFVGILKDFQKEEFLWIEKKPQKQLKDYLIDENSEILDINNPTFVKYLNNKYNKGSININELLQQEYLVIDWRQSDLRVYCDKVPTLRTGRHGILYVKNGKLHKLTGYEALLLQGFPKKYADKVKGIIPNNKLLSQAGNAMTVPVIQQLGENLLKSI